VSVVAGFHLQIVAQAVVVVLMAVQVHLEACLAVEQELSVVGQ